MNVGEKIRFLRTQKGITQEELGKIIGVQRAAVQKWECGKTQNLKRETIKKLASYFEVEPNTFIFGNDYVPNQNTTDDENIVIYNRNGKTIKKKFTQEQMDYLDKFINSISESDSDL